MDHTRGTCEIRFIVGNKVWIKYLIPLVIFIFIGKYIYQNFTFIMNVHLTIQPHYLAGSFFLVSLYVFLFIPIWQFITEVCKCNISYRTAMKARIYSEMGKYIPGKVGSFVMIFYYYTKFGVSKRRLTTSLFYELVCSVVGGMFVVLVSLYFVHFALIPGIKSLILFLMLIMLVILHPKISLRLLDILLRCLNKEALKIDIRYTDILKMILLYGINWLVFGLGMFMMVRSFYPISLMQFPYVNGTFVLSTFIGIIAIFTPAGLGVREGIILTFISIIMPTPLAAVVSIGSRLLVTCSELFIFGGVNIYNRMLIKELWRIPKSCISQRVSLSASSTRPLSP